MYNESCLDVIAAKPHGILCILDDQTSLTQVSSYLLLWSLPQDGYGKAVAQIEQRLFTQIIACFYLPFNSGFSATEYVAVVGNVTHLLYRPLTTLSSRSVITIMETALGTPSPSYLCRSSPWNTMQAPSPIGWASGGLGAVGAIGHAVGVLMNQFWELGIKPSICNCTSI